MFVGFTWQTFQKICDQNMPTFMRDQSQQLECHIQPSCLEVSKQKHNAGPLETRLCTCRALQSSLLQPFVVKRHLFQLGKSYGG